MLNRKWSMLVASLALSFAFNAEAQNDVDVLRYSAINWGSTARSLGMGNAFGALGADPSVMSINPAGLGLYRRSEFTLTPGFQLRNTDGELNGNTLDKNSVELNFGNLAFIWAFPSEDKNNDWRGVTFGLGYNRLNDFNSKGYSEGINNKSSLIDSWVSSANGTEPEQLGDVFPFDVGLGWEAYLFDPDTSTAATNDYISGIPAGGALQRRSFESRGGMGEFDISLGTNYMDKLFFGGTIGIVNLRYREKITWEEIDVNHTISNGDSTYNFESYKYVQDLNTEGSGYNFKFGIIYKPTDYFRVGLAIHSPTFLLSITDDYKTSVHSEFEGGTVIDYASPDFIPFEYDITTPFRTIGSMGFVLGKYGVVGVEYEYVDYSRGDISPRDDAFAGDFAGANSDIKTKYTSSHNFRVGGELRYGELRFRLGGGMSGTPFSAAVTTTDETDQSRININGGFGLRKQNFYFDAGYSLTQSGAFSGMYALDNDVVGVTQKTNDHRLLFTFGWLF